MRLLWRGRTFELRLGGTRLTVLAEDGTARSSEIRYNGGILRTSEGAFRYRAVRDRGGVWVWAAGRTEYFEFAKPAALAKKGTDEIRSPMTGRVVSVAVKAGDAVKAGQVLVVVVAMKMEFRIEAPHDGAIEAVHCRDGDLVDLGKVLVELK